MTWFVIGTGGLTNKRWMIVDTVAMKPPVREAYDNEAEALDICKQRNEEIKNKENKK